MYITIRSLTNGFLIESHAGQTYVATAEEIGSVVTAALAIPVPTYLNFNGGVGGSPTIASVTTSSSSVSEVTSAPSDEATSTGDSTATA